MARGANGLGMGLVRKRKLPVPLYYVIHNGQSLSVGTDQNPVSTTQTRGHLKLFDSSGLYPFGFPGSATLSAVPLVAPQRAVNTSIAQYPLNIGASAVGGETAEIAFCNTLTDRLLADHISGLTCWAACTGEGGAGSTVIFNGGTGNAFQAGIWEAQVIAAMIQQGGLPFKSFAGLCAILTHGETDALNDANNAFSPSRYQNLLVSLQAAYQTQVAALTKQTTPFPLLMSQQNSNPGSLMGVNTTAAAMYNVAQSTPANFILACAKYFMSNADSQHLNDYRHLASFYSKAMRWVMDFGVWSPVWPTNIVRVANVITLTFAVPVAPLVFDLSQALLTTPHTSGQWSSWANGYGFEAWDQQMTITNATNASPIVLTVSGGTPPASGTIATEGVLGNTNANVVGPFTASGQQITLTGTTGNGTYTGGGTAFIPIGITSAVVQNGNQVVLTMARSPVTGCHVAYAEHGDFAFTSGPFWGRRGLLRDSDLDPICAQYGSPANWCVEFVQAVA